MYSDRIVVLTYNVPHRKTYDLLCLLKTSGYEIVDVYARRMTYVKKRSPFLEHRPNRVNVETKQVCKAFGYNYVEVNEYSEIQVSSEDILLIAGAGLLPDTFVKQNTIINGHPGYIPECRGLDSYKWAIEEKKKIGVSTHLLGQYVDAGIVIERRIVDINESDSFHSVAYKIYEAEVEMMVSAIERIKKNKIEGEWKESNDSVHKRMPLELEKTLIAKFEDYKNNYLDGEHNSNSI